MRLILQFMGCAYTAYYCYYKFFPPALADCLSLESEWQQVSSRLQDVSQNSDRSQTGFILDGLDSSTDF